MLTPRRHQREGFDAFIGSIRRCRDAMPIGEFATGTGKSLIMAMLAREVTSLGGRALILSHTENLVEQNALECRGFGVDCGMFCAGLQTFNTRNEAISASVQTFYGRYMKNVTLLGRFKFLIIDECHLVNPKNVGMYKQIIETMTRNMPGLRVMGLTATDYLGDGTPLVGVPGAMFTNKVYRYSMDQGIEDGYLSRLVIPKMDIHFSCENLVVGKSGDFTGKSLASLFKQKDNTEAAVKASVKMFKDNDRHGAMFFGASVDHCYEICDILEGEGLRAGVVSYKTKKYERNRIINSLKKGKIDAIVNKDALTTGFNVKHIDFLGYLRKTASLVWWVQSLGRGTRIHDEWCNNHFGPKDGCMVADFCRNVEDMPGIKQIPTYLDNLPRKKHFKSSNLSVKICKSCKGMIAISARNCKYCGYEFSAKKFDDEKEERFVSDKISQGDIMGDNMKSSIPGKLVKVQSIRYKRHKTVLKVTYVINQFENKIVDEYVPIGRHDFDGVSPRKWSKLFYGDIIHDVDDAVELAAMGRIKKPTHINVAKIGGYDKVMSYMMSGGEYLSPMFKCEGNNKSEQLVML